MKKIMLVIMGVGVGLSSAAYADVTIYGRIHGDIESTKAGSKDGPAITKVQSNYSRIGFKGFEDLGDGLKAIWQVENGVAINDGSAAQLSRGFWGTRETFLGLSDETFGTIKLGSFLPPTDDLHSIAGNNFQAWSGISNDSALWLNGSDISTGGFDARLANSVEYLTPVINGLSARIQYSLTSGAGSKEATHGGSYVVSGNVLYEHEAWRVGYGVQQNRDMRLTSNGFYGAGLAQFLAVGYDFGSLYLAGLFEHDRLDNILLTGMDRRRNYGSFLLNYSIGNSILSAQYGKATSWNGGAGVDDSGAWMGSLAYNYKLSKNTQIYALYTRLDNEANGAYVLGGNPTPDATPAIRHQHSLAVGMWQNF